MKKRILESLIRVDEADITDKILKEPGRIKQLQIAWKHDGSLPQTEVSRLGTKPDDRELARTWSAMLDKTLARTNYGDLSRDMKFPDWLTKLYTSGAADWEDISGEGGDALGAWHALSTRGLLKPQHQDLNRFTSLQKLYNAVVRQNIYGDELKRIKNAAELALMKKDAKDVVLVDDDRYWAAVPLNYGACYVFNNTGHTSNFCTGGSSGANWFRNYAPDGPIVMIIDKSKIDTADGKWQFHAPTNQLVNSSQDRRYDKEWNDERFGQLFPGLMRRIVDAMQSKQAQIAELGQATIGRPYDIDAAVNQIKAKFPRSYASEPKGEDTGDELQGTLGLGDENVPESHLRFPENQRRYLSLDLRNAISPDRTDLRNMLIVLDDGRRIKIEDVRTAAQAVARLTGDYVITPRSIQSISKVR